MRTEDNDDGDDVDQVACQDAFRAYMLGGRDNVPVRSPSVNSSSPASKSLNDGCSSPLSSSNFLLKTKRKYYSIIKAFHGTLKRDWLEVDENLCRIVRSIAHIRERCWITSRSLAVCDSSSSSNNNNNNSVSSSWRNHGYRTATSYCFDITKDSSSESPKPVGTGVDGSSSSPLSPLLPLHRKDLDLALTHDLLQHERMLAGLRQLLQSLGQAQEAMGRRLDELLQHHLECLCYYQEQQEEKNSSSSEGNQQQHDHHQQQKHHLHSTTLMMKEVTIKVEECEQIFGAAATELYRKQLMADELLKSAVQDNLLFPIEENSDHYATDAIGYSNAGRGGGGESPRRMAEKCADQWSWTKQESYLKQHEAVLQKLLFQNEEGK